MTAPVTFNYPNWIATFPELAGVSSGQAGAYFVMAGLFCKNTESNPAYAVGLSIEAPILSTLLDLVTAHLAWLLAPRNAQGKPDSSGAGAPLGIVGRIASASEGSVSVSAEWAAEVSGSEAWWLQTQYGATYWTMTAPYRMGLYAPNPTQVYTGVYPYGTIRGLRRF